MRCHAKTHGHTKHTGVYDEYCNVGSEITSGDAAMKSCIERLTMSYIFRQKKFY